MSKNIFLYIFLYAIINGSALKAVPVSVEPLAVYLSQKDSLKESQILYNGRIWRNLYSAVKGDQFLFSKDFLPGTVSMNGKTYTNLNLNYDIYNDEILTPNVHGEIIQLNKEMVDSFTLVLDAKTYRFFNIQKDSLNTIKGFVKVLYYGKSSLYVKYKKEIQPLAVEDKYDLFFRTYRVYFVKGSDVKLISNKRELLKVLYDYKTQIKDFMKKNSLKISKKDPESYIPVIRYYDSIIK